MGVLACRQFSPKSRCARAPGCHPSQPGAELLSLGRSSCRTSFGTAAQGQHTGSARASKHHLRVGPGSGALQLVVHIQPGTLAALLRVSQPSWHLVHWDSIPLVSAVKPSSRQVTAATTFCTHRNHHRSPASDPTSLGARTPQSPARRHRACGARG